MLFSYPRSSACVCWYQCIHGHPYHYIIINNKTGGSSNHSQVSMNIFRALTSEILIQLGATQKHSHTSWPNMHIFLSTCWLNEGIQNRLLRLCSTAQITKSSATVVKILEHRLRLIGCKNCSASIFLPGSFDKSRFKHQLLSTWVLLTGPTTEELWLIQQEFDVCIASFSHNHNTMSTMKAMGFLCQKTVPILMDNLPISGCTLDKCSQKDLTPSSMLLLTVTWSATIFFLWN